MSKNEEKTNDWWTDFTYWAYSSFPEYLTIAEKKRVHMNSWIKGDCGYWLLFSWRIIGCVALIYFQLSAIGRDFLENSPLI